VELVRKRSKRKKGFTLMEIMVVVLILGLIAGYAIPRYLAGIQTAKLGQVIANYDAVRTETWAAYYIPGSTQITVAQAVAKQSTGLTNPFNDEPVVIYGDATTPDTDRYEYWDGSWVTYSELLGGEVVLDYTIAGEITITAYDDVATAEGMQEETIDDPKLGL